MLKKKELLVLANRKFPVSFSERKKKVKNISFSLGKNPPIVEFVHIWNVKYKKKKINRKKNEPAYDEDVIITTEDLSENFLISEDIAPESEALIVVLVLRIRPDKNDEQLAIQGFCYGDSRGESCEFFDSEFIVNGKKQKIKYPRNLRKFAIYFTTFFIFDFLKEKEINANEWNDWDEIVKKHYS